MLFRSLADHVFSAFMAPCGWGGPSKTPSDRRLKADIEFLEVLENGLTLHTFRYEGSDTEFTGVMAQEVLEQEAFRHAVTLERDGYYRVDYAALGLAYLVSPDMQREGRRAIRRLN